jgi:hypothetical protein
LRRGLGVGSNGSISVHNSSSMIGASIPWVPLFRYPRLIYGHPHFCNTDSLGGWLAQIYPASL